MAVDLPGRERKLANCHRCERVVLRAHMYKAVKPNGTELPICDKCWNRAFVPRKDRPVRVSKLSINQMLICLAIVRSGGLVADWQEAARYLDRTSRDRERMVKAAARAGWIAKAEKGTSLTMTEDGKRELSRFLYLTKEGDLDAELRVIDR